MTRAATPADLDAVNAVVDDAVANWGVADRVRRLASPLLRYRAFDLEHMDVVVTCESNGGVIALAAWERAGCADAPTERSALLLHGLYVAARAQRRGVGGALLERALGAAGAQALDGVVLRAWREAEGFFLAHGFTALGAPDAGPVCGRLWRALR